MKVTLAHCLHDPFLFVSALSTKLTEQHSPSALRSHVDFATASSNVYARTGTTFLDFEVAFSTAEASFMMVFFRNSSRGTESS
jgi:hypothetical protein